MTRGRRRTVRQANEDIGRPEPRRRRDAAPTEAERIVFDLAALLRSSDVDIRKSDVWDRAFRYSDRNAPEEV